MSSSQAACGTATLGTSSSAPGNGRPTRLACTSTPSGGHLLAAHQSCEFTVVPPPMRCHNCARSTSATCGAHEDIDDAPLTKVVSAMHLRTSEMLLRLPPSPCPDQIHRHRTATALASFIMDAKTPGIRSAVALESLGHSGGVPSVLPRAREVSTLS